MTDQELVLDAINKTALVISDYIEPGPRDARKVHSTLDALIFILQDQALADAVGRLEKAQKDETARMLERGEDPTSYRKGPR
ncbi:MAG: hypothetical protein QOI07_3608 [Verrucomicrobiota bacterium]|jgi:hypothetical protein